MYTSITLLHYKKRYILFAFLSMVIFHIPLLFSKKYSFYKLLGTGNGPGFSFWPNLKVWGILLTHKNEVKEAAINLPFINKWIYLFTCKSEYYILESIEGHGLWDGKEVFGKLLPKTSYNGQIVILTRATIKLGKLRQFWKYVPLVSKSLEHAPGLIKSYGIGELPWVKQATLSIWESREAMQAFAYHMQQHREVIAQTRRQNWYKEEMFVRFKLISHTVKTH